MSMTDAGQLVLLIIGACCLIGALLGTLRALKSMPNGMNGWTLVGILFLFWGFGGLLAGTGVFGLPFMAPYTDFVRAVDPMTKSQDEKTYGAAFEQIGNGRLPVKYADLALSYALENPIDGMDTLLQRAISRASSVAGRLALENAAQAFVGKQRFADLLTREVMNTPNPVAELQQLDATTRKLVAGRLLALPDSTLGKKRIDRKSLEGWVARPHVVVPKP